MLQLPFDLQKCQAGPSGRKNCHRLWVLLPRRQWSGLSQASSSTQRVNQGCPFNPVSFRGTNVVPPFPRTLILLRLCTNPQVRDYCLERVVLLQKCMGKGLSKEAQGSRSGLKSCLSEGAFPKPLSSSMSSSVKMSALFLTQLLQGLTGTFYHLFCT